MAQLEDSRHPLSPQQQVFRPLLRHSAARPELPGLGCLSLGLLSLRRDKRSVAVAAFQEIFSAELPVAASL